MTAKVRVFTRPIPVCQEALRGIAADLVASGLRGYAGRVRIWAAKLSRRKGARRAPPQQRKMTPALQRRLRRYLRSHPNVSYQTAAHKLNLNTGRSSEANVGIKV